MKWTKYLADVWRKLKAFFRWSSLREIGAAPFRGGLQAALSAWRDFGRKLPPDDIAHIFRARGYPGSRTRRYLVHVPRGNGKPQPLVLVLHGCRQDHRDIEQITGFNALADRHGFLVVYPFITSYRGLRNKNCWGWWFDREIHAGAGEVEDLWQIIEEVKQGYAVDPRRIHVAGLSSGAGMAVAMMVAHADKIASGGSVAGLPYAEKAEAVVHALNQTPRNRPVVVSATEMRNEMGDRARLVPIRIVHSRDDDKVLLRSAEVLRDSWGYCFGVDVGEARKVRNGRVGDTDWELRCYFNDADRSVIETLFLDGPGHGWYGGNPGDFSFPEAPDISQDLWKFFKAHPLQ